VKVAPKVTAYNARGNKLLLKLTKAPATPSTPRASSSAR
jgi:hypothetical protein